MNKRERLQRRVDRVLAMLGLEHVEQLVTFSKPHLWALPRVGRTTMNEIERQLKKRGLSLIPYHGWHPVPIAIREAFKEPNKNTRHYRDQTKAARR